MLCSIGIGNGHGLAPIVLGQPIAYYDRTCTDCYAHHYDYESQHCSAWHIVGHDAGIVQHAYVPIVVDWLDIPLHVQSVVYNND